jgi:hypothetical protein
MLYNKIGKYQKGKTLKETSITPLTRYYNDYNSKNPYRDYLINEKDNYLNKGNKGLQNLFNVNERNFPEQAEQRIHNRYDYDRNNYVIEQYAKENNIDLTDRESIMNNLVNAKILSKAMPNSKYAKYIEPSLWARTKGGAVSAANSFLNLTGKQGPTFTPDIKGLTPAEEAKYYYPKGVMQKLGNAADALSFADIPGSFVMKYATNADQPTTLGDALSGRYTPNTLNAASLPGIVTAPAGLLYKAPDVVRLGGKVLGKYADDARGLLANNFTKQLPGSPNFEYKFPKYNLQSAKTQVGIDPVHYRAVDAIKKNSDSYYNFVTKKFEPSIKKSKLVNPQFGHDYVLPEGVDVNRLNEFARRSQAGLVEPVELNVVYESLVKLNPELKNINVNKVDFIHGVASHVAPQDLINLGEDIVAPKGDFLKGLKRKYNDAKWNQFTNKYEGFGFRFSPERQKEIMKTYTKQAKNNLLGKIVNRSITPIGYDLFTVAGAPLEVITPKALKFKPKTYATKNRFDSWRLYNGLEPEFNTFSKNADNTLALNDFKLEKNKLQKIIDNPKKSFGTMEIEKELNFGGVHGNGWITKGVDEQGRKFIDFTDTWDLQPLKKMKFLPNKVRDFEVSSLTGGKPFDLKNRIYYNDSGEFFDHKGNKLIETIEEFSPGTLGDNQKTTAKLTMLGTKNAANTKQMDVLRDWDKASNNKFIKGAAGLLGATSIPLGYMAKRHMDRVKKDLENYNKGNK